MIFGSIEIPNIKFQVGIVEIVLKINSFIKLNYFRHRPHRVFKREDISGLPDRAATRVLYPAGEAGGQPGNMTVSQPQHSKRGGWFTLE